VNLAEGLEQYAAMLRKLKRAGEASKLEAQAKAVRVKIKQVAGRR